METTSSWIGTPHPKGVRKAEVSAKSQRTLGASSFNQTQMVAIDDDDSWRVLALREYRLGPTMASRGRWAGSKNMAGDWPWQNNVDVRLEHDRFPSYRCDAQRREVQCALFCWHNFNSYLLRIDSAWHSQVSDSRRQFRVSQCKSRPRKCVATKGAICPHLPHSSDLALFNFFLFGHLKRELRGSFLQRAEGLLVEVRKSVGQISCDTSLSVFRERIARYELVIRSNGDYFEQDNTLRYWF
jgi:hypothetical protein